MNKKVTKKKKILFVTYGGGHVDIVVRLIKQLQKNNEFEYSVLGLTIAGKRLAKEKISYKGCNDYLFLADYKNSVSLGEKLADKFWLDTSDVSYEESVAYTGVSMHDLIADKGEAEALSLYEKESRYVFCPVDFMSSVLGYEKPDIVVTTCYVRMEKAAIIAAKKMDITSVFIEDLLGFSIFGNNIFSPKLVVKANEMPDNICVLNREVKQLMLNVGVTENDIYVTGQPVLSDWSEEYVNTVVSDELNLKKRNSKKLISYFSTGQKYIAQQHIAKIIETAKKTPEWRWIIKLHPSNSLSEFSKAFSGLPDNVDLLADINILELTKASDAMIIHVSTIGFISLFFSVPLLVMNDLPPKEHCIPYVASGAAIQVRLNDDLKKAINEKLSIKADFKKPSPLFENTPNASENIINIFKQVS